MDTLILNGSDLSLETLYQVVFERRKVEIAPEALERAEKARQVLFDMAAEGKPVYGLNRGVGWNKDKEFDSDFFEQYNRNLINSHSLGVLPRCSVEEVRAMLCIRLNTALCGRTGISTAILQLYQEFFEPRDPPRCESSRFDRRGGHHDPFHDRTGADRRGRGRIQGRVRPRSESA